MCPNTDSEQSGLQLLSDVGCHCPGESLTYECTVLGESDGTTVWTGSAFNCTSRQISLFHSRYGSTEGTYGECDDIVGQSVRVNANPIDNHSAGYYVSQLTVPIRSDIAGRTIECFYHDGDTVTSVGRLIITTIIGNQLYTIQPYMCNIHNNNIIA